MAILKGNTAGDPSRHAIPLDLGDLRSQGELVMQHAAKRAEQVLADARREREKLIATAADEGRAKGLAQGTADGLRAGTTQGAQAAMVERRGQLEAVENSWKAIAADFVAQREDVLAEARREVIRLAMAIATRVIKRSIEADPSIVVDQVSAALTMVLRPSRVVISINPADRPLIEAALPALLRQLADSSHIELTDDVKLARGACSLRLADAMGGTVDASLQSQLDRIAEALVPTPRVAGAEGSGGTAGAEVHS
jgi:flagellar assembly protein FliH